MNLKDQAASKWNREKYIPVAYCLQPKAMWTLAVCPERDLKVTMIL